MNNLQYYQKIQKISFDAKPVTPDYYGSDDIFSKVFDEYISDEYNFNESKKIIIDAYIDYKSTGYLGNALHLQEDQSWRNKLNFLWLKYIKFNRSFENEWNNMKENVYNIKENKKIISFHIRHPNLAGEQVNYKMPNFSQYDEVIHMLLTKYNKQCIFIFCTDLIEAYDYFYEKYNKYCIIHPNSKKTHNYEAESHNNTGMITNTDNNVKDVVLSVLMLSLGDHFIFSNSNMATAALYINPKMIPYFLIG